MAARHLFSIAVLVGTLVAVLFVVGGIDLPGGGDEPDRPAAATATDEQRPGPEERPEPEEPEPEPEPPRPEPRANPDDVRGTAPDALNRPANLRRALRVIGREADRVEGRLDFLRLAPGRIDTRIARRGLFVHLQVRAGGRISSRSENEFPVPDVILRRAFPPRRVDPGTPAGILRAIDRRRDGDAAADLDYMALFPDPIGGEDSWSVFLERGARPRSFRTEGERVIPIG